MVSRDTGDFFPDSTSIIPSIRIPAQCAVCDGHTVINKTLPWRSVTEEHNGNEGVEEVAEVVERKCCTSEVAASFQELYKMLKKTSI